MPVALPIPLFVLGAIFMVHFGRAQLPAIFEPKPLVSEGPPAARPVPVARSPVSDRMRQQMAEVILAAAKAFEAPATPASVSDTAPLRSEGAVMMDRIFVKSSPLRRDQVRPPDLSLLTFHDLKRDDRRATGISATLFRVLSGNGEINLNILNGAGQGVDHGRDFTRFELEFKLRF